MWKRIITALIGLPILLFVALQLVPYGRDHTNPAVVAEPDWDTPQTRELFMTACGDCHSNETVWPWYSNIAPVSWLVQHDVEEGRAELNISRWGQGENEAHEAAETVQEGEMPPPVFLVTHPEASLSDADKQILIRGLIATFGGEREHEDEDEDEDENENDE
ncbi:MAG: heme-binding domain-containing protein [Chloroflexi bacterium]|nr:heme-binding domain-containing protein [Chloroflexota bacterium]MBP8056768.1 heme-binding domain-containing protein [Chloroflexota bacterium]